MKMYTYFLLLGLLLIGIATFWNTDQKKISPVFTNQFTASQDSIAFIYRKRVGEDILVRYDIGSKSIRTMIASEGGLWSPKLSPDGKLLVSIIDYGPASRLGSALMDCGAGGGCRKLFDFDGSISNPVRLHDGRLLFVGGEKLFGKKRGVYFRKFDFYEFVSGFEFRKLTNMAAGQLSHVSSDGSTLFFEIIKRADQKNHRKSRIYSLAITKDSSNNIALSGDVSEPHVTTGKHLNLAPNVSVDGSYLSFRMADRSDRGKYIYDIAIKDMKSGEVTTILSDEGWMYSNPLFVNKKDVVALRSNGKQFEILKTAATDEEPRLIGSISVEDIEKTSPMVIHRR